MTRKVCIAVDDSSVSKGALDWASKALLQPNDEVHIVSVLEPIMRSDYGAVGENSYPVIQNQVGVGFRFVDGRGREPSGWVCPGASGGGICARTNRPDTGGWSIPAAHPSPRNHSASQTH